MMYYRIAVKAESGLQKAEEELFCYLESHRKRVGSEFRDRRRLSYPGCL